MDSGEASDDDVVLDGDVTSEGGHVGHDDVVADLHVMGEVGVGEEMVVRPNDGGLAVRRGSVDGAVLAEHVVIADAHLGGASAILEVLGPAADAGEGKHLVVGAEDGVPFDDDVGMEDGPRAEHDVLPEDAVGADSAILGDLCTRVKDSGGMDARHGLGDGTCPAGISDP